MKKHFLLCAQTTSSPKHFFNRNRNKEYFGVYGIEMAIGGRSGVEQMEESCYNFNSFIFDVYIWRMISLQVIVSRCCVRSRGCCCPNTNITEERERTYGVGVGATLDAVALVAGLLHNPQDIMKYFTINRGEMEWRNGGTKQLRPKHTREWIAGREKDEGEFILTSQRLIHYFVYYMQSLIKHFSGSFIILIFLLLFY